MESGLQEPTMKTRRLAPGSVRCGRVVEVLGRITGVHGVPACLRSRSGPEFASRAILHPIHRVSTRRNNVLLARTDAQDVDGGRGLRRHAQVAGVALRVRRHPGSDLDAAGIDVLVPGGAVIAPLGACVGEG
jgi:limonene-1,2-epoxide hydrolase